MLIEKSRSGVYQDTSENRRLNRVGQRYGERKQPEEKKGGDNVKDVKIVTSKAGIKTFLSGKVGGDYYRAVAEAYKALRRSGKSKSVSLMLAESGSGAPSKDVPARKYVEAVTDGATHDEAVAFADDCYEELLAKIKNVQEKVYSEGLSTSTSSGMFAAVNKWFNAQKFEKKATSASGVEEVPSKVEKQPVKESVEKQDKPTSRVTFADVPHAKDVNLKKYLTDSRRKQVDYLMKAAEVMPKSTVKQMHDAAVKKFNDNFDSLKKSERASALYVIMKYKDLMNKSKSLVDKNKMAREDIVKRMSDAKVSFGSIEQILKEGAEKKSGDSGAYKGDIEVDLSGSYNDYAWKSSGRSKPKKTYQLVLHTDADAGAFNRGTLTRDQIKGVTLVESNPWEGIYTKIKDVDLDDLPVRVDRK